MNINSPYESHADFEGQCRLCHEPLKADQHSLCVACHENVQQQVALGEGTHDLIDGVNRCADCHPDHLGREFDTVSSAFVLFDHTRTIFSLARHTVDYNASLMECADCHEVQNGFSTHDVSCENCHATHDSEFITQHIQDFGSSCLVCHDGVDRMTGLDHQSTSFPLEGKHLNVSCVECHPMKASSPQLGAGSSQVSFPADGSLPIGDPFKDTPTECAQCHQEPEVHRGIFAGACDECHTTSGWTPASLEGIPFNHAGLFGFSLARHAQDYHDQPMTCLSCHEISLQEVDLQTCINCHTGSQEQTVFMQAHRDQFGDQCLDCHDGSDRMSDFDHASFFPLEGLHADIACSDCHQEKKFAGTPSECVQCHAEPEIHAGFFGLQCQYCHTAQAWSPAQLLVHRFPLDHGSQVELECQVCHPGSYAETTCYGCHDHQPDPIAASHSQAGVALEQLANCASCHPDGVVESE